MEFPDNSSILTAIADGTAKLRAAFEKLPPEARNWKPGPAKWSGVEVVVHTAETDIVYFTRIAFAAAESGKTVPGFDENKWASGLLYNQRSADDAFAAMASVRKLIVGVLRALPADAWERTATHSERGPVTVRSFAEGLANHVDQHVAQLERNLAAWKARQ